MKKLELTQMELVQGGGCYETTAFGVFICGASFFVPVAIAGCIAMTGFNLYNCA